MKLTFRFRSLLQRLHLWATLFVGVFLIVVTTTGVAALFEVEVNRAVHPGLHQVTAGPALGLDLARSRLQAARPDLSVHDGIKKKRDAYLFYVTPRGKDEPSLMAYVDPGTGRLNGVIEADRTVMGWLAKVHYTLLADQIKFTYAKWVPAWIQSWIGATLSDLLLKITALALLLVVVTGAVLWWPKRSQWRQAFTVRRGRSQYLRDLDWHRLIGVMSLPFLFMWAMTALNFYEPFQTPIKKLWYAVTFAGPVVPDAEVKSKVMKGTPFITAAQAERISRQTVPNSTFISYSPPDKPEGVVRVWLTPPGADPYPDTDWPGQMQLQLDAYSGQVLDDGTRNRRTWGARAYNDWFYATHAGTFLSWPLRLIWAIFGLTPLFLAFSGLRMWWVKRQARRRKTLSQSRKTRLPSPSPAFPDSGMPLPGPHLDEQSRF